MKYSELNNYRNEEGYIDLDKIQEFKNRKVQRETRGNIYREKDWIDIGGKYYLVRTNAFSGKDTNYCDYAELIVSELAKQAGFECADYDLIVYNGQKGVMSQNFLEQDQEYMSMLDMLGADPSGDEYSTTTSIDHVLDGISTKVSKDYYSKEEIQVLSKTFAKMVIFDTFIMSNDRHLENFGAVVYADDEGNRHIKFAPLFDNEISLMLDVPITDQEKIANDRDSTNIYAENQFQALAFVSDEESDLLDWQNTLDYFCESDRFFDFAETCYRLDIVGAIDNVEKKIGTKLPDLAKKTTINGFNARRQLISEFLVLGLEEEIEAPQKGTTELVKQFKGGEDYEI